MNDPCGHYSGRLQAELSPRTLGAGDRVLYCAPSLVLHYIRRHRYAPPVCFVEAVLNCPEPRSQDYRGALKRLAQGMADLLGPATVSDTC